MRKVATIVETRAHPALGFVMGNFMSILPKEWEFQIFYEDENVRRQLVRDLPLRHGRELHWNKIPHVPSLRAYSCLLLGNDFWEKCHGDLILIFQTDSMLCKDSKYKISDFENHDYIGGVPARKVRWRNLARAGKSPGFMNGGLSLRQKKAMLDAPKPTKKVPEDVFYSKRLGVKADSVKFSWDHGWVCSDIPFGLHKPWLGPRTRKMFARLGPEAGQLRKLNSK